MLGAGASVLVRGPSTMSWHRTPAPGVRCWVLAAGTGCTVLLQDPSPASRAAHQSGCTALVRTGSWLLGAGSWIQAACTSCAPPSTFQEQNPTPGVPLPAALSIPACPRGCVLTRGSAGAAIALGSQSQGPGNACAVPRLGSAPLRSRCLSLSPRCRARRRRQRSGGGGRGQRGSGGSERRCWAVAARMPGP